MKPEDVIPEPLGEVMANLPYWFVIGGHAVRCICPYRPSRDVDFGVHSTENLVQLLRHLRKKGAVEILERAEATVHLLFDGINVSIFVLDKLVPFTEGNTLTVEGILATKLKAILGRGTRRDFFDLYITMQIERRGIAASIAAMRQVYGEGINEPLLYRALTYFEDADREAPLQGEGPNDWEAVKDFLLTRVGKLLVPPQKPLAIQSNRVDVRMPSKAKRRRK